MALTFVGAELAYSGGGSITVNKPAGTVAGDVLYFIGHAQWAAGAGHTLTNPSGFTTEHSWGVGSWNSGGEALARLASKVAGSSEPSSYTMVANDAGNLQNSHGLIVVYRDVDTAGGNVDVAAGGYSDSSDTSLTCPSVTTTVSTYLVTVGFGSGSTATPATPPGGHTERFDSHASFINGYVGDEARSSAGSTGTRVWTISSNLRDIMLSFAIPYVAASFLTDPALSDADTLGTDVLLRVQYLTDPALTDADTLGTDVLRSVLVITDPALADGDTLGNDQWLRILYDPTLTGASSLPTDTLQFALVVDPYWVWRVVRQNGNLYLVPVKSRRAWLPEGDIVSEDFRFTTEWSAHAMQAMASAWATHKNSSTATLKAAIDAALSTAGFRGTDGELI